MAFLLLLPALAFFAGYLYNHADTVQPTGFIQYDNVSYIAYAHQYLDADTAHLQYSNPFNDTVGALVYFQTQTLFFALLLRLGIPANAILIPFSLICIFFCFRIVIGIYRFLVPPEQQRVLHLWLLAWGGGALTICGLLAHYILHRPGSAADDLFLIDPENGWWGLNLGRSLFFACEAYFHLLFLGCIYALLKRKWAVGLLLVWLLSLSHPFTGIELIGIVGAWIVVEFFVRRQRVPLWFAAGMLLAGIFHIYYYLIYLNGFSDHHSVSEQYALNWRLGWYRMLPAYCFTGALAAVSIYRAGPRHFFSQRHNRLLLCWFAVAFVLSNHELFMKPHQPIHFARGYIWASLFLLGLPALQDLVQYLSSGKKKIILAVAVILFLLDNASWIGTNAAARATQPSTQYISSEQQELLHLLDSFSTNRTLIVSSDEDMGYLSTVHTEAYPWYSHPYTTPFARRKKEALAHFLQQGIIDPSWKNRQVNYLLRRTDTTAYRALGTEPIERIISTDHYTLIIGGEKK